MDERSKERLTKLVEKTPGELTKDDIGFLRARRSYLTKAQVAEFDDILNPRIENQTSQKETVKQNGKTNK